MKTKTNNTILTGTITHKFGEWVTVLIGENSHHCNLSARLAKSGQVAVVGDRVRVESAGENGQIVEILPRRNRISRAAAAPRPGGYRDEQVLAANVDLMVTVLQAANPAPRWALLDRYLVLAEAQEIPALVVINKVDLLPERMELETRAVDYRRIGYPVLEVSAESGEGLEELRAALFGRTAILLGHSGVGKSSLLNALQPGLALRTGETNAVTGKGRHTTTAPTLYMLPEETAVMDTPGVREFGLWEVDPDDLAWFFPEMRPYLGQCRFRQGCQHDEEPGCAVRKAVMAGEIHPLRYQSFLKLRRGDD